MHQDRVCGGIGRIPELPGSRNFGPFSFVPQHCIGNHMIAQRRFLRWLLLQTGSAFIPFPRLRQDGSCRGLIGRKQVPLPLLTHTFLVRGTCGGCALPMSPGSARSHYIETNSSYTTSVRLPLPSTILSADLCERIDIVVQKRAQARWDGNYGEADRLLEKLETGIVLPHPSIELVMEDIPRRLGGGSTWKLQMNVKIDSFGTPMMQSSSDRSDEKKMSWPRGRSPENVLNLAHAALGMAVSASERHSALLSASDEIAKQNIIVQAKRQLERWNKVDQNLRSHKSFPKKSENKSTALLELHNVLLGSQSKTFTEDEVSHTIGDWISVESHLQGRKAADAAFWFALAGIKDGELYKLLTAVAVKEMQRFGARPSCRVKDLMAVLDRLAAAGIRNNSELDYITQMIIQSKTRQYGKEENLSAALKCPVNLHSESCLLMLWKFSARQRKQKSFLRMAAEHGDSTKADIEGSLLSEANTSAAATYLSYDWNTIYRDASRPLVIDVGCGMGVSLLGLATIDGSFQPNDSSGSNGLQQDWSGCNFLGVDLSALAIGYANNIATRWNLTDKLFFAVDDSERLLNTVAACYPGPVAWVLVQFPTPYRLNATATTENVTVVSPSGNSQLPKSASDGFMVTPDCLRQVGNILRGSDCTSPTGHLLLQSNCEDVAIYMKDMANDLGMSSVKAIKYCAKSSNRTRTQRGQTWMAMGGKQAIGPEWWLEPILPRLGRTETEVGCILNETPVHRCVLRAR